MDIVEEALKGRQGLNQGLTIGSSKLNEDLAGLCKGSYIGIAAESKVGKTTFVVDQFLLQVWLNNPNQNIKWIFYSFEINRLIMAFKFASYFILKDYDETLSINYLLGRAKDKNKKLLVISDKHLDYLKVIQDKYIKLLFGEYVNNKQVKEGKIIFFDKIQTPAEINLYLKSVTEKYGVTYYENYEVQEGTEKRIEKKFSKYVSYPDSPHIILIVDHMRKLKKSLNNKGGEIKQTIDTMSGILAEYAKDYQFSCIAVIHLNRTSTELERLKFLGEFIFPSGEEIKDSGNLLEDVTDLITLFNPLNPSYRLKKHFGLSLEQFHENYRSAHLVAARYASCPNHYRFNFNGAAGIFTDFEETN